MLNDTNGNNDSHVHVQYAWQVNTICISIHSEESRCFLIFKTFIIFNKNIIQSISTYMSVTPFFFGGGPPAHAPHLKDRQKN